MKFKAKLNSFRSPLWGVHIIVPDKVSNYFIKKDIKRIIVILDGLVEYHAALMPTGKGNYFIIVNKDSRKKLGKDVDDELSVELIKDESKYGMPMPEEFQELLYQDEEGNDFFHALTPGKQRSLLYIIGKPKSVDARIRKGLIVLTYLKSTQGQLSFPDLNQAFKDGKNRDLNDWF